VANGFWSSERSALSEKRLFPCEAGIAITDALRRLASNVLFFLTPIACNLELTTCNCSYEGRVHDPKDQGRLLTAHKSSAAMHLGVFLLSQD
jgi:hypothetical protein